MKSNFKLKYFDSVSNEISCLNALCSKGVFAEVVLKLFVALMEKNKKCL